jgi:hypothetical protein
MVEGRRGLCEHLWFLVLAFVAVVFDIAATGGSCVRESIAGDPQFNRLNLVNRRAKAMGL